MYKNTSALFVEKAAYAAFGRVRGLLGGTNHSYARSTTYLIQSTIYNLSALMTLKSLQSNNSIHEHQISSLNYSDLANETPLIFYSSFNFTVYICK